MFFKRFFPSMKEKLVHGAIMVGALYVAYLRGRAAEEFWEIVAPVLWVLSAILIWHALVTAIRLNREIKLENNTGSIERELPIFSSSGTRATIRVAPQVIPFYKLKIVCITLILCIIAVVAAFLSLQRIRIEAVPPRMATPISEPFSAIIGATFFNPKRGQIVGWWLGDVTRNGEVKTVADKRHASVVVYITATNLQSVESLIRYYGLQAKTQSGEWVDLRRMDAGNTALFLVFDNTGFKVAHLTEVPNLFDKSIMAGKIIKPGHIFTGWAFFEYPKQYKNETFIPLFRVTLHDMRGIDYVSQEQAPEIQSSPFELQGGGMIPIQSMDITGAPTVDDVQ
jgi:hypothetical protein